jgi:carboxymethylenebutenolidase
MKSEYLTITRSGGSFQGYFTAPDSANAPGVIVVQEIFGVNSHIRSVCERLTEAGYAALAPDIFWRVQPGIELGYTPDDIAEGRELKAKMDMDDVIEDVRAAFAVLGARPECLGRKLGIVGFCYGGLITYTAATRLNPACASSYYGGGIVEYLAEADRLDCPIQFHFGEQDAAIPLDQVAQVRQAVSAKADAEVFVYEGANHGFHCDQRGSYNEASAKIAWQRTLGLFGKHLA